eukprot:1191947-Prymnesium_polylepis.2
MVAAGGWSGWIVSGVCDSHLVMWVVQPHARRRQMMRIAVDGTRAAASWYAASVLLSPGLPGCQQRLPAGCQQ